MKSSCDACGSQRLSLLHEVARVPFFQNKLFPSRDAALSVATGKVALCACADCGLVFNAAFNNNAMEYDDNYQNSQDHSPSFKSYLDEVADRIQQDLKDSARVVEIGCGKGYFLGMLRGRGVNVTGFDPAYEGSDPTIHKEYFSSSSLQKVQADAIIMRHTLEHIEKPLAFLQGLSGFLAPETRIYIEVPRFEWIVEHNAFWDIFHEHCNYFTESFFRTIFDTRCSIAEMFSGQYMLITARLGDLRNEIPPGSNTSTFAMTLDNVIARCQHALGQSKRNFVWGAGAKGIAFCNLLDPEARKVEAVVDINPRKYGQFLPVSGQPCVSPAAIAWDELDADDCLWIMNGNYSKEILQSLPSDRRFRHIVLGESVDIAMAR